MVIFEKLEKGIDFTYDEIITHGYSGNLKCISDNKIYKFNENITKENCKLFCTIIFPLSIETNYLARGYNPLFYIPANMTKFLKQRRFSFIKRFIDIITFKKYTIAESIGTVHGIEYTHQYVNGDGYKFAKECCSLKVYSNFLENFNAMKMLCEYLLHMYNKFGCKSLIVKYQKTGDMYYVE